MQTPARRPILPPCPRCGFKGIRASWQEDRAGRSRIRGECWECRRYRGWLPIRQPFIFLADQTASPAPVLDALTWLDDIGAELRSDGAAVWVKPSDWRRLPPELHALIRQCSHKLARLMGRRNR
jgi:hypothetical protein